MCATCLRAIILLLVLRPSSAFRVVRAKLPPLAFSIHPSSILANRLDPQPRTKDDDEEENWDMTRTLGEGHACSLIASLTDMREWRFYSDAPTRGTAGSLNAFSNGGSIRPVTGKLLAL